MLNNCIAYVQRKSSPFKNVYKLIQLIMLFLLKTLVYIYVLLDVYVWNMFTDNSIPDAWWMLSQASSSGMSY